MAKLRLGKGAPTLPKEEPRPCRSAHLRALQFPLRGVRRCARSGWRAGPCGPVTLNWILNVKGSFQAPSGSGDGCGLIGHRATPVPLSVPSVCCRNVGSASVFGVGASRHYNRTLMLFPVTHHTTPNEKWSGSGTAEAVHESAQPLVQLRDRPAVSCTWSRRSRSSARSSCSCTSGGTGDGHSTTT